MWRVLEILVPVLLVLVFITEFLIPIIKNEPLFGSFRKDVKKDKDEKDVKDEK